MDNIFLGLLQLVSEVAIAVAVPLSYVGEIITSEIDDGFWLCPRQIEHEDRRICLFTDKPGSVCDQSMDFG